MYDLDYYNLAHEPKFKIDEAKELVGSKPAFNTNEQRFKADKRMEERGGDDDEEAKLYKIFSEIPTIHVGSQNLQQHQTDRKGKALPFNTGDIRFRKMKAPNKNPGPGYYADGNSMGWKKRTFNILFAEI